MRWLYNESRKSIILRKAIENIFRNETKMNKITFRDEIARAGHHNIIQDFKRDKARSQNKYTSNTS